MAAVFRRMIFARSPCKFLLRRQIHTEFRANKHVTRLQIACGCATGAAIVGYLIKSNLTPPINTSVVASKGDDQRSSEKRAVLQTQRELRFLSFASVEYDGNVYMTPQDFLESVTEEAPRPRAGRRHLSCNEVEKWFYGTSRKGRGSTNLFRNLHEKGLISYTEYLFLLCVLTKPKSGFQIAFNMFDTDGNQRVDKKEFLVLQKATTARTALSMVVSSDDLDNIQSKLLDVYESRFGESRLRQTDTTTQLRVANIWTHLKSLESVYEGLIAGMPKGSSDSQAHDPEDGSPIMDTTLTVHFFGRKGKDTLKYEDFHRFMDNLQTEVLELEFGEFSRGMQTIDEVEFAQILLRYTILTTDEHEEYLQRLRSKVTNVQGITFQEFKDFCQFLNNLDDFALAMRMYTYANHPISQEDFKRAVMACTGQSLSDHVVDVVYKLFDKDNDNHLSHKEFISVMKDRLHRGFRNYNLPQNNWDTFKSCVKNEMRAA